MSFIAPRHAIAAAYAGLFFGIGVFMPFFPLWLEQRGFNAAMIAVALAVMMSVRLFTTPLGGMLADRTGKPRATLILYALGTAISFVGLAFAPGMAFIVIGLGVAAIFWQPSLPVLDAYAVARRREGLLDYGRARLWGSLAFIGGNFAGGMSLGWGMSDDVILWLIVAGSVVAAGAAFSLREAPAEPRPVRTGLAHPFSGLPIVLLFGMGAAALVQGSHAVLYTFASVNWRGEGMGSTTIGLLWSLGVIAEVVLFHFGTAVTRRLGPGRLLLIGGLAGAFRFSVMAFDPPLGLLLLLQPLHALTFGCTYLGLVELVASHAPPGRGAGVQAIAAWVVAISMTGATLASGPLWEAFGAAAFLSSALLAACGAAFAMLLIRRQNQEPGFVDEG